MASRPLRFHPAKIVRTSRTISSTTTFAAKIAKHPWMWRLATSVHPDDLFDMRCAARKILVSPFDHILVGKAHEKNAFNLRFSLSLSFWDSPTKQPSIIDSCDKSEIKTLSILQFSVALSCWARYKRIDNHFIEDMLSTLMNELNIIVELRCTRCSSILFRTNDNE